MAFRNHLCADQHIDLSFTKSTKHAMVISDVSHGVAIDTTDCCVRKKCFQFGLKPLGSLSDVMNVVAVAVRTS